MGCNEGKRPQDRRTAEANVGHDAARRCRRQHSHGKPDDDDARLDTWGKSNRVSDGSRSDTGGNSPPSTPLDQDQDETEIAQEVKDEIPDTPRTRQWQALAEAISTAMSKGLEPLLVVKESNNKATKYRGTST